MKMWLPLLCAALISHAANGRLGETEQQLDQRYGRADMKIPGGNGGMTFVHYSFHGFFINVGLLDGRCASESYSKSHDGPLSEEEVAGLLNANGTGWKEDTTHSALQMDWTSVAGDHARWRRGGQNSLSIISKRAIAVMEADAQAKAAEHLKGF